MQSVTEFKHDGLAIPGRVVLAHEPAFDLGQVRVSPPTRQVERGGRSERVEPRVMQVIVALSHAGGQIVTRDELIHRCWDGRIVSDDAINRVLSRIRQIAAGIGAESFIIETVPRVGYRLVPAKGDAVLPSIRVTEFSPPVTSRRGLMIGAGAAALGVAAIGIVLQRPWRHRPLPEAERLYQRGALLSREGLPGQVRQAVSYFERAAAVDPEYADAWGALALSYSHLMQGYDRAELASLPQRIRAAADRALDLDPDNADAQLALIFMTPFYRNWAAKEVELRRVVKKHPRNWLAHGRLAVLLYQVGRLSEGIELHRQALRIEPILPIAYYFLITNLSALGRAQEAEVLIEKAHERWPAHPALWNAKFKHLLFSGRPKSAAAFAMDPEFLPSGFAPDQVKSLLQLARAVDTREPSDVEGTIKDQLRMANDDVNGIPQAAQVLATLGRDDLVLESLERYYLGWTSSLSGGGPPPARYTDVVFTSAFASLRQKPRFAKLLSAVGLEDYWRRTGTVPDFRRG